MFVTYFLLYITVHNYVQVRLHVTISLNFSFFPSYYYRIFTDGSKVGDKVGAAVVHKHNCKSVRLPNNISIFRAELYAHVLAIEVVRRIREQNFII